MIKPRVVLQDLLAHLALFLFIATLMAFLSFAVFKDALFSYRLAGGFAAALSVYWILRALLSLNSRRRLRVMGYAQGKFIFMLLATFVMLLFSEYLDYRVIPPFTLWTAVFLCLSKAAYTHIAGIDYTLDTLTYFSKQPVAAIRKHNNRILALFILLAAVMAALTYTALSNDAVTQWLSGIGGAITRFLQSLFGHGVNMELMDSESGSGTYEGGGMMQDYDPPVWLLVAGWIIRNFFALLTVVGIGIFAYVFFMNIKGFRFEKRADIMDNGDLSETVAPDLGERFGRRFWGGRMPSDPVRRAFYKKVRKYQNMVEKSDTALEMAGKIREREDIGALARDYQEARYGHSTENNAN